jgi:phage shock protein A
MGFLNSIGRFLKSAFGLAQGKTERMTDSMISANADTIRSQFRKTKEDWNRDYQEMRNAVAELINIREMKIEEAKKLSKECEELQQKMNGAIELYKKTPDERYKSAYTQLAQKCEENEGRVQILESEVDEQQKSIERYKLRLRELQTQIDSLNKEEAETVADIVSSQKIKELNDRLSGVSTDSASKNLDVIRAARQKSKAVAKLSSEMSNTEHTDFDAQLKVAGSKSKYLSAFDSAVGNEVKNVEFTALPK